MNVLPLVKPWEQGTDNLDPKVFKRNWDKLRSYQVGDFIACLDEQLLNLQQLTKLKKYYDQDVDDKDYDENWPDGVPLVDDEGYHFFKVIETTDDKVVLRPLGTYNTAGGDHVIETEIKHITFSKDGRVMPWSGEITMSIMQELEFADSNSYRFIMED